VPASKNYIKVLEKKRLEAMRPHVRLPNAKQVQGPKATHLFEEFSTVDFSRKKNPTVLSASISSLDDGRISLSEALASLDWSEQSNLDFTISGRTVQIIEVEKEGVQISPSKSRLVLPLWIRRRLKWSDRTKLLVISHSSPVKHILIYEVSDLLKSIKP
jgi:hypothetical protein